MVRHVRHVWLGHIVRVEHILIMVKFRDRAHVHLATATVMRGQIRKVTVIVHVLHRMYRMRRRSVVAYIRTVGMHVMRRGAKVGMWLVVLT